MSTHSPDHPWQAHSQPRNEDLPVAECWDLINSASVGRIGFSAADYPQIFPVNFTVVDQAIYFRTTVTGPMSVLDTGAPVAFEVDAIDEFLQTGWSVLVLGRARRIDDPDVLASLRRGGLPQPWAAGVRILPIGITPERVTGRRIHPG